MFKIDLFSDVMLGLKIFNLCFLFFFLIRKKFWKTWY